MNHLFLFSTQPSRQSEVGTPTGTSTARGRALLWLALGAGVLLAAGRLAMWASECGEIDNTRWSFITATTNHTEAAVAGTNIYLVADSKISIIDTETGLETVSNTFIGVTLGRPIIASLKGGSNEVIIAGSTGYAYGIDASTLITNWTRNVLRGSCGADTVTAAPVVQLWNDSGTNFQAARNTDIVMVGTHYGCGTTSANRVYCLDAATGGVLWIFNATGSQQLDAVYGLALDYGRNTVYVTSYKSGVTSQSTVWALNTITGAKRWSVDLGAVACEPVSANGAVYVGIRAGTLYKLDPVTGVTIWSRSVTSTDLITSVSADAARGFVYVVDSGGTLYAYQDHCSGSGSSVLWAFKPINARVTSPPAILSSGLLYVASSDGKVWQVRATDGVGMAHATVGATNAPSHAPLAFPSSPGSSFNNRLLAGAGGRVNNICIPWPDTTGDKGLVGGNGQSLLTVPNCYDPNAPASGLAIYGDLGTMTSVTGQGATRQLMISPDNQNCYPYLCVTLLGDMPSGLSVSALSSAHCTTAWDTNSFLVQGTPGLPMQFSLTVTSSVPGTYLTALTLANAGTVHVTKTLVNIVIVPPLLAIVRNGANAEVTWATNAVGFQLQCAPSLTLPAAWQTISNGITTAGGLRHYLVTDAAATTNRFFRLKQP